MRYQYARVDVQDSADERSTRALHDNRPFARDRVCLDAGDAIHVQEQLDQGRFGSELLAMKERDNEI